MGEHHSLAAAGRSTGINKGGQIIFPGKGGFTKFPALFINLSTADVFSRSGCKLCLVLKPLHNG